MAGKSAPLLHRDNPDRDPLSGHVKVTREDWLNIARDVLVNDGVAEVKILGLANRLDVSRSSFYWYFKDRRDLLNALLEEWETRNSATLRAHCALPASSIAEAACNFFWCFVAPGKFDTGLDFAVREWARREDALRARVEQADAERIADVTEMFARHGFGPADADGRARILYFMQLGYHALDVREPMDVRMSRIGPYLRGFTGDDADEAVIADFIARVMALETR